MALELVSDYILEARSLLQDETAPYRYSDNSLKTGLSLGLSQVKRMRPDLTLGVTLPIINSATAGSTVVPLDDQYHLALLSFMVGYMNLRDEEGANEQRTATFISAFTSQLMSIA